jgi:hypothetical protein
MPENIKPKWTLWVIVAALVVFPLVPLFHYLGRPAGGFPAALCALMLAMVVRVRWELSRHPWFWPTVIAIAAIHVPLIWFVPWTSRWVPAVIITPFCIVDALVMLAIINSVPRLSGSESSSSE